VAATSAPLATHPERETSIGAGRAICQFAHPQKFSPSGRDIEPRSNGARRQQVPGRAPHRRRKRPGCLKTPQAKQPLRKSPRAGRLNSYTNHEHWTPSERASERIANECHGGPPEYPPQSEQPQRSDQRRAPLAGPDAMAPSPVAIPTTGRPPCSSVDGRHCSIVR